MNNIYIYLLVGFVVAMFILGQIVYWITVSKCNDNELENLINLKNNFYYITIVPRSILGLFILIAILLNFIDVDYKKVISGILSIPQIVLNKIESVLLGK